MDTNEPRPETAIPKQSPQEESKPQAALEPTAQLPQRIILEQPVGAFARLGRRMILLALIISILFNFGQKVYYNAAYKSYYQSGGAIKEKFYSGNRKATDRVAIIRLTGTIIDGEGFVKDQIDRAMRDPDVKAAVVRIDSPGGTVTGSHYLYHHLSRLAEKKPVVISMGSICASGGYYIAMAVGENGIIYAEPTTLTGSIGVLIPHYDISKLLEHWKIEDDTIFSHEMKLTGSPTRKRSDEQRKKEREVLQGLVDDYFITFKEIVKKGRPNLDSAKEEEIFSGRIFTASQALDRKLVDKIGFLEDAIDLAVNLAIEKDKISGKDNVRIVKYTRHVPGLKEVLLGTQAQKDNLPGLSALLDLTVPRAYYLPNWMPGVLSTKRN